MSESNNNTTMKLRIQARADEKVVWESNNPILLDKELGYERDTGMYKMGDGKTPWNKLSYYLNLGYGTGEKSLVSNTCEAIGRRAIAIGETTKAEGTLSYAEGRETYAQGECSHAEGYRTFAASYSHAEGNQCLAEGIVSHAEGELTQAQGQYSHSEGHGTIAAGDYSHAEGNASKAIGLISHAEGNSTFASANEAHAEGLGTKATGLQSHAEGYKTEANGQHTHSEGYMTIATGNMSHTEGQSTIAEGEASHAEGSGTNASGKNSHAEGQLNSASGEASHAEGTGSYATGEQSHAEGGWTTASGMASHSEGNNTIASGIASHAEGAGTIAKGVSSHTEGNGTETSGDNSHAEGYKTKAIGTNQHVQGRWNIDNAEYAHIVGNGSSNESRSNAHTLDWDGNAWFAGKVTIGENQEELITTASVDNKINLIKGSTIAELDTLEKLAEAINNNPYFGDNIEYDFELVKHEAQNLNQKIESLHYYNNMSIKANVNIDIQETPSVVVPGQYVLNITMTPIKEVEDKTILVLSPNYNDTLLNKAEEIILGVENSLFDATKIIIPRGKKFANNEILKQYFGEELKTIIRIDEDGIIEKTTFDE